MRTRPWPLTILAWIHILGPLGNLFLSAWLQHLKVSYYCMFLLRTLTLWEFIDLFALFPLAGFAILKCRKWSYPIFLAVALWTVYSNLITWAQTPMYVSMGMIVVMVLLDVFMVGYFLLPAVRTVYADPRVRWWESKPRYQISVPVVANNSELTLEGTIQDFSEGGVFVECSVELTDTKKPLQLAFTILNTSLTLSGLVVYKRRAPSGSTTGYGLQFLHTRQTRRTITQLSRSLKKAGTPTRSAPRHSDEFVEWLVHAIKTGHGWIPELPGK